MTRYKEPSAENTKAWNEWVASRPESVRVVAERFDPWTLYRLRTTNQRVFVLAFSEPDKDGKVTCRVGVTGEFNLVTHERHVFGIDPDDLEECDLPRSGERLGSLDLPIEVLRDLMTRYPGGAPMAVMAELITKYPLRDCNGDDDDIWVDS